MEKLEGSSSESEQNWSETVRLAGRWDSQSATWGRESESELAETREIKGDCDVLAVGGDDLNGDFV